MQSTKKNDNAAQPCGEGSRTPISARRRATGPRTDQGKRRSKINAVKHGIFANAVLLPGESQADFDALLAGYREYFQPVGTFEDSLVEILVVNRWRWRRLLIAERAEIQAGTEFLELDAIKLQLEEVDRIENVQRSGGLIRRMDNPRALSTCLIILEELKESVSEKGFIPENDQRCLTYVYGEFNPNHWDKNLFGSYLYLSDVANKSDDVRREEKLPSPAECKSSFVEALDNEIQGLKAYQQEQKSNQLVRIKLARLGRTVPDSPRLEALLRYATSLERAFDRTLNQLERAQRMRLGQSVPPPINVNLSQS